MDQVLVYIIAFLNLLLGLIVLKNNAKKINFFFFVLTFAIAGWTITNYFAEVTDLNIQLFLTRLTYVFSLWVAFNFLCFVLIFPKEFKNYKLYILIHWLIASALTALFLFTPLVETISIIDGVITIQKSQYFILFLVFICEIILLSISLLFIQYFKSIGYDRVRFRYILSGTLIVAILAPTLNVIIPLATGDWSISRYGPMSTFFFIGLTSYGILRGGLFDVRMAVVRSVTYAMVIATLAGLYTVTTLVLSSLFRLGDSSPIELVSNVVISLVLVFLFQPLRRFFDRITNEIFYKDNYDTDDFFGRVNKILAITTDLKDLLRKTSLEISKTLKASQAFFYILTDNGKIGAAGTAESSTLAEADLLNIFSYASKKGQITVATLLEDNDPVKKLLSDNKIEIALPLMKGKKLVGLFLMGENMSSNYTGRDISVLETLSNGLVVAILNALAVQEIRDFNVTLRQKIDEATKELRVKNAMLKKLDKAKDEFVSMASHQLRTPLTSVKGYLSMVVDGDAGKVTKQQKELLDEAYVSNEKMVNLVNDFLNVSRIQTGKFMLEKLPIDLSKLVDQEVKGLVQNAKKRGIKLAYRADKDIPSLMVDEGKIRQVVMNYIDNAIYYSHQDSTIKIDLVVDKDEIVFTVKDTGIGVPISEQAGLFTKFYRASNAKKQRPDGTGVGLYLAKKIVSAHDGKIIFKTVEGQGSTFGFSLPIKELKV